MPNTITVFDLEIPVLDYVTAWEQEQLELLIASPPKSQTRADLEALRVFTRSKARLGTDFDVDEYLQQPVRDDELAVAVEELTAPFFAARRLRAKRNQEKQLAFLSSDALRDRLVEAEQVVETIRGMLNDESESDGGDFAA